jgi:hypothetical protein
MSARNSRLAGAERSQRLTGSSADSRFTKKDLAMSAMATRDIEPGEEITTSRIASPKEFSSIRVASDKAKKQRHYPGHADNAPEAIPRQLGLQLHL